MDSIQTPVDSSKPELLAYQNPSTPAATVDRRPELAIFGAALGILAGPIAIALHSVFGNGSFVRMVAAIAIPTVTAIVVSTCALVEAKVTRNPRGLGPAMIGLLMAICWLLMLGGLLAGLMFMM